MFWLIAAIGLALFLFKELYRKRRKYPPGPTPLPLLGNMLSIMSDFPGITAYKEWKKRFGPIYTYWLGPWPIVTVNDYSTIQELFINDGETTADRVPFSSVSEVYRGGLYGIADTNGKVWREQRRFALHTLRDFGLGKAEMQERILNETADLLAQLENDCETNGKTKPSKYMEKTVASVINLTLFGFRFDQEHESEFYRLNQLLKDQLQVLANPLLVAFFSVPNLIPYIPFVRGKFEKVFKVRDAINGYFQQHIDAHKKAIDYLNDDVGDFCDAYIKEMYKRKDDPDTSFHDKQFVNVCGDLWLAGVDTTATTMGWGVIVLLHHPEVLSKLHDEFDRVIDSDRLITTNDKPALPYTNAFLNEVQRWANIAPQNLLRRMNKEVTIGGVTIPEGASITPQISMLLADETVFPEPDKFKPERFLDGDGKLKTFKEFLPFSVGKRQCPGEGLAKMELFLFFSNLTHRFHIENVDPSNPPSLVKQMKTGGKPGEFECILRRRIMGDST
ncbi:hypothetical protein PRIPAC_78018 [Pristionchus pacificus]|uniref:Cytochrome P450 n=1 Tax=Pristionchus pacificus TaxID=54126 RepID=A0A2A6C207_PRIPA|nr:hypothetical protein PRIPAC_78018 [Pristionchus pacificus]|eukprot:PDM72166.1 cytochrome P450 [Pristionchus pacificus]